MKFNFTPNNLGLDERQKVNEKLIYLIKENQTQKYDITSEDVYNSYTGLGGLHGLNFNDFNSYHAFSDEKKKHELGQFFTPHHLSKFVVESLPITKNHLVADLTCGTGNFFNFLPEEKNIYGVELDYNAFLVSQFLYPKAEIVHDDIQYHQTDKLFDFIILNPPFNLKFGSQTSQDFVLHRAHDLLKVGGIMVAVVPTSYLNDDFSSKTAIQQINERYHFLGQYDLGVEAFTSTSANISTKIMYFAKKTNSLEEQPYSTKLHTLTNLNEENLHKVQKMVTQFIDTVEENKINIRKEQSELAETSQIFLYKVNKYLYDLEANPKTKHLVEKGNRYLEKFFTQKKPEEMEYSKWLQVKITENKVLRYLKTLLSYQDKVERDEIRVVKTQSGLKFKPYSEKTKRSLTKKQRTTVPFHELFKNNHFSSYMKLIEKKKQEHVNQTLYYDDIDPDCFPVQRDFVRSLVLTRADGSSVVLNDVQQEDTLRMLTKRYGYLQWDTGSGKTVSAAAQMLYRQTYNNVRNVFVVSNAIAINNTLEEEFIDFGFDVVRVKTMTQVRGIKPGQVVLLTFEMLTKLKKHVQKQVKMSANKILFVLDEADNIVNPDSARYKAVKACFSKAKYKLLMSGTSTRNNVGESFTAFEMLYNSSENFINSASNVYEETKDLENGGTQLEAVFNENLGKPFPPYKKGFKEFKKSFSPHRSTVFGVEKHSQHIYNSDHLKHIIKYSMVTRSFEEVSHKKLYTIKQHTVGFTDDEKYLYQKLVNEFHEFYSLYKSTGSSRKDTMLRIIQQLNALLYAPVRPEKYDFRVSSSKYPALHKMCADKSDEWVVVGAKNVDVVHSYAEKLEKDFPGREIFVITGQDTSLNKRKQVIKQLERSKNGILVCTQQSLSSSMNIGFVDNIIILQLQWNFPVMKQFFARFIRFTSTEPKEVTFLVNNDSVESNLLKLLLAKEKMNRFMKNDESSEEDLYSYFGVEEGFFDTLFKKEIDEKGKSYISWG